MKSKKAQQTQVREGDYRVGLKENDIALNGNLVLMPKYNTIELEPCFRDVADQEVFESELPLESTLRYRPKNNTVTAYFYSSDEVRETYTFGKQYKRTGNQIKISRLKVPEYLNSPKTIIYSH